MYTNKAVNILLAATLFSSVAITTIQAICETACPPTRDPSADFTISYNGRCTPTDFNAAITNTGDHSCLLCLYNSLNPTNAASSIDDAIKPLCIQGYKDQEYPFSDITRMGSEFDNEHYNGGGKWNYEIERATGEDELQSDAARINNVYYYQAQKKVITFPADPVNHPEENIVSFNPHTEPPRNIINTIDDLDGCDLNAAFCCFAQDRQAGDNNGNCATPYEYNCIDKNPSDNTNICYIDHERSSKSNHVHAGFSIFGDLVNNKENIEGSVHCHGFAWGDDELQVDNVFKGNLLTYVSMYDHMTQRGYVRNIPGSPMCACAENMAVVTRADCTEIESTEAQSITWTAPTVDTPATLSVTVNIKDIDFNACTGTPNNNNLEDRVRQLATVDNEIADTDKLAAIEEILVGSEAGKCNAAIESFLADKNITRTTA